jgi:acetyl-CoA carboxylase, biotin carboxylase subunit
MKVLVANRGEIAVRVLRACRDLGMGSVAVYSEADRESLHVRYADEAVAVGPTPAAESYLNIPRLIEAAEASGADAVHPGYGFLSENPQFASAVEDAGLVFVGPRPKTLALTGDKLAARRAARACALPVLPGPDEPLGEELSDHLLAEVEYPVLVKAAAGGGGRGIRLAQTADELETMIEVARTEAHAAFGDDTVYLEPLVQRARHIEVQIVGDGQGHVLCLGERECSIQRRRQKLIEESPANGLTDAQRTFLYEAAVRLGQSLNYRSLGTVEFLLGDDGDFHFIEVNPRIQVEHPVTEMVTGLDLVHEQLRLAAGHSLRYAQEYIDLRGAAIEARVLAEDPAQNFIPAVGKVSYLKEPGGPGIRVDSALYHGMPVTTDYDSMLAKVIAWGENREAAISRLRRALREFQIGGVMTDLEFLTKVVESGPFVTGRIDTTYLDTFQPQSNGEDRALTRDAALAAALLAHLRTSAKPEPVRSGHNGGWRTAAWREQM